MTTKTIHRDGLTQTQQCQTSIQDARDLSNWTTQNEKAISYMFYSDKEYNSAVNYFSLVYRHEDNAAELRGHASRCASTWRNTFLVQTQQIYCCSRYHIRMLAKIAQQIMYGLQPGV